MLKVFLKHKIFEYCINVIFNTIEKNFYKPSKLPRVGEIYSKIQINSLAFPSKPLFNDCTITSVYDTTVFGENFHCFEFKPKHSSYSLLGYLHCSNLIK